MTSSHTTPGAVAIAYPRSQFQWRALPLRSLKACAREVRALAGPAPSNPSSGGLRLAALARR